MKWYATVLAAALLVGCNSSSPQPEVFKGNLDATPAAATSSAPDALPSSATAAPPLNPGDSSTPPGHPPVGMMEDPRTITDVEGRIVGLESDKVLLEKGPVTLVFHLTPKTVIKPAGHKLALHQQVKIHIEHIPEGMNAGEIDIQ